MHTLCTSALSLELILWPKLTCTSTIVRMCMFFVLFGVSRRPFHQTYKESEKSNGFLKIFLANGQMNEGKKIQKKYS